MIYNAAHAGLSNVENPHRHESWVLPGDPYDGIGEKFGSHTKSTSAHEKNIVGVPLYLPKFLYIYICVYIYI